jgi:transposase
MNFPDSNRICTFGRSRVYFGKSEAGGVAMAIGFPSSDPHQALSEVKVVNRRLGCLPIVKHFLDQLKVREFVDNRCPRGGQIVSHGECVEALVMAMFLDTHALSRVGDRLANYDLESIFGRPILPPMLHDMRLGECLDAIYDQAPTIHGDMVAHAVPTFSLDVRTLNCDGTKILLHGQYDCFEDYVAHCETIAIPERGWNPEGRKDLKQLQSFLVVNRDHFPLLYSWADGANGETKEYLKLMKRLDTIGADVKKSLFVADCKICAAENLIEAENQGMRLVTLIPQSFSIRKELVAYAGKQEELPLLLKTKGGEEYRGISIVRPRLIDPTTGEERDTPSRGWRYLVIHSSLLAEQAKERRVAKVEDERATLERKARQFEKKVYACKTDANKVADSWRQECKSIYHSITWELMEGAVRHGRGRPSAKGMKTNDEVGWGVRIVLARKPEPVYQYDPEGMFVLLTTVPDRRVISDLGVLEAYRERNVVELCFKWMKGPAAVAPVFLKLPSRIQSLGFILVVWMMVYSLIQRELRRALAKLGEGAKAPHPDKRWTDKPTTRGVLDLFIDIEIQHCSLYGAAKSELRFWDDRHQHVMNLLGIPGLYRKNSLSAPS